jgi:CRP-like cAMP-binding protein
MDIISKILATPTFKQSNREDLHYLVSFADIITLKRKEYVYQEGDDVSYFYIIDHGVVEISKLTDKAGERTFALLLDGDIFGLPELFHSIHSVSALTLKKCKLLRIPGSVLFDKLILHPRLTLDFMHMIASNLRLMQQAIVLETAEKRITAYLNWLSLEHGEKRNDAVYIKRKMAVTKIASILAVTREYVFKVFKSLEKDNILEVSDEFFIIKNPSQLHERAGGITNLNIGYYHTMDDM